MLTFWHEYSDLISAFLAALLGGCFTMKGVTAQVKQQAKQQATATRRKINKADVKNTALLIWL